jgi:hypothetical protein
VTQRENPSDSGNITSNPRLRRLLEDDDLDWENPHHREMYLKEWVKTPRAQEEEEPEDDR